MKQIRIFYFITIFIVFLFSSCRPKTVETVEKAFAEKYFLSSDTSKGAFSIEINVDFPTNYKNRNILDAIQSTIFSNLFGKEYLKYKADTIADVFIKDLKNEYRLNNEPLLKKLTNETLYALNNEFVLDGFTLINDGQIYTYGINQYIFSGGAHGMNTINYFNFNLKTAKLITEKDLFKADGMNYLTELIKKRIVVQSKEDAEPIVSLEKSDYWIESIKPNGNFFINDLGINYVFNPYEIAPYYMGITEVNLSYEQLKEILQPDCVINYLVKAKN